MRGALAAGLSLALLVPGLAAAQSQAGRPGTGSRGAAPAPRSAAPVAAPGPRVGSPGGSHPISPAPFPGTRGFRGPYYRSYYYPYYYPYYAAPFWWGLGWGWGYYPSYPQPAYPVAAPPEETRKVVAQLAVTGGPTRAYWSGITSNEVMGGVELHVDGPRFGLGAAVDGFSLGSSYSGPSSRTTLALGSAHLTIPIASGEVGRLRAELGGTVVSWPDTFSYYGASSLGPDVGVSGHVGLVGPLGIEGHARYTPFPRYVVDLEGSLALRFGPVAPKIGWRDVSVGGESPQPSLRFYGPQLGLSFVFF